MPNTTTSRIWSNDASHSSTSTARGTVWIIGYIRPTLTATYKFQLTTRTNTLFYLSSDDNPLNKKLIANYTSLTSQEIRLEKDKKFEIDLLSFTIFIYLFCLCFFSNLAIILFASVRNLEERNSIFSL